MRAGRIALWFTAGQTSGNKVESVASSTTEPQTGAVAKYGVDADLVTWRERCKAVSGTKGMRRREFIWGPAVRERVCFV